MQILEELTDLSTVQGLQVPDVSSVMIIKNNAALLGEVALFSIFKLERLADSPPALVRSLLRLRFLICCGTLAVFTSPSDSRVIRAALQQYSRADAARGSLREGDRDGRRG